jgi:AcrR family transcriptional regulator
MADGRLYHHGNLRRALMDAALALFAERGRFDFTMRELARAAGVTHNAPYRHFEDRWALLDALAAEGFVLLREASLVAASPHSADPRARVSKLGEAYIAFAAAHPHHFRLMFLRPIDGASSELAVAAQASFALLEEAIDDAKEQGYLRPGLGKRDAVITAWSLVHGVASLVVGGQLPPRALKNRVAAITEVFASGAFVEPAARKAPKNR